MNEEDLFCIREREREASTYPMFVLPPPPRNSPLILLRVEAATLELIMPNFHLRRRTSPPKKQEQTLFKDLRRQDIEIKNDETKKERDILNGFLNKRKLNEQ